MSDSKQDHRLRLMVAFLTVMGLGGSLLWISRTWAQQSDDLPTERQLPSDEPSGDEPLAPESRRPDEDRDNSNDGEKLQGEDVLPDEHEAIENAKDDVLRPILRLAFEGHSGNVRTIDISDGGRTMVTAGEDKVVHVWRRTDVGKTGWLHRRTLRWPVLRADRGRIQTAVLRDDEVAFAGYGAYGGNGEIRLGDAASGDLAPSLVDEHRQAIFTLDWAPGDERRLASVDLEGHVTIWQQDSVTKLWNGEVLVKRDGLTYDKETEAALLPFRSFVPLTFSGTDHVVVPHFKQMVNDQAVWVLHRIDVHDGTTQTIGDVAHAEVVRDLAATSDGRVLCSAGWDGTIAVWTLDEGKPAKAKVFKTDEPALFIDLAPDGKRLLVGTEDYDVQADEPTNAKLKLYDLEPKKPKLISERALAYNAVAGAWDADQNEVIVAQGSGIEIYSLDEAGKFRNSAPTRLAIPAKPVLKLAFARESENYQLAFGTDRDAEGKKTLDGEFDLTGSRLLGRRRKPIDAAKYFSSQRTDVRWLVGETEDQQSYQLYEAETPRGVLPLQRAIHGVPTSVCTLPKPESGSEEEGEKPATGAVIVGTDGRNGIYVYAADQTDPPRLLRHFRGHPGAVRSVATSADGNYLASGGDDSLILIWNLQDVFTAGESVNRWGVEFELDGDQLVAAEVREDGPLYFRGVRAGDRLSAIEWTDNAGNADAESDAEKMFERLTSLPFDTLVEFSFTRFGRAQPGFLSYAAWRPLAKLFVDQTREWAFWTPAGFYDASFNGHQRFGWQINKGLDLAPDFFRAAQFRKLLERSDVMQNLLAAGSLPAAMRRAVGRAGAPTGQDAIVLQYQNKPQIELLDPVPGSKIEGDQLTVNAKIKVPLGASLVDPRAFISGVPAVSRKQLPTPDGEEGLFYQWQFRLPHEKDLQLEVLAATEAQALDRIIVDLKHVIDDAPRPRRMHVLAIGVSDYPDPQIPKLNFAAKAAHDVTKMFRDKSSSIYRVTSDELVDEDATRPLWRVFAQQAVEELSESVSPDDLVIMYLCGHGMRDRRTNQWYFVTADTTYSDLMNDEYSTCIAFSDLAALAKLPCRKLAILDSCHSGAVQPLMERDDLKSALRFLQDDVVLTLTASEGDELAAEQEETQMGRFTTELRNGLNGDADADGDRTVTLNEVIRYVIDTVSQKSEIEAMPQHPTASPSYLLRTLDLPLTTVSPESE